MIKQRSVATCDICGDERIMPFTLSRCNEEVSTLPKEWKHIRNIDVCASCLGILKKDYSTAIKCGLLK